MLFEHFAVADREARRRQRIDHFVGEQHAAPSALRRHVQPFDQVEQQRVEVFAQAFTLAFAQIGAGFEDGVTRRQCIQREQFLQRDLGESTAATAEFHEVDLRPKFAQDRRHAVGDAGGEQRAELRRSDEIAAAAELGRTGAVVTKARRVQAQLHETRERNRAAVGEDLFLYQRTQALAVRQRGGVGWRQMGHAGRNAATMRSIAAHGVSR